MTAEVLQPFQNGVVNKDLSSTNPNNNTNATTAKKSRENERRRRRRKQKKNNKASDSSVTANANNESSDNDEANGSYANENSDPQKVMEQVVVEYVLEKAELDDGMDEEFRKIFEKFNFTEAAATEENDTKDESAQNAESKKKVDSDSEEEEQDNQQKEKGGISNKKKKLLRRMKIAELKQICSRPDVVEVWDATAADPKLLVFLKSYRNTVPVPRHWCQKRKFLQGNSCDNDGALDLYVFGKGTLD